MHFSFASDVGVEAKGLHLGARTRQLPPHLPSESAAAVAAKAGAAVLEGCPTALQQRSTDLAHKAAQAVADAAAAVQAAAKQVMLTGNSAASTAASHSTGEMVFIGGTPAVSPPADSATRVATAAR